jgi:hypothetical protein
LIIPLIYLYSNKYHMPKQESPEHPPSQVYDLRISRTQSLDQLKASRPAVVKGRRPGESPHTWITGPDPKRHAHYTKWHRARAQAKHRGIEWALSFDQWLEIWGDNLDSVGRATQDLCLARTDQDQGWIPGNVSVISRRKHCRRLMQDKAGL